MKDEYDLIQLLRQIFDLGIDTNNICDSIELSILLLKHILRKINA